MCWSSWCWSRSRGDHSLQLLIIIIPFTCCLLQTDKCPLWKYNCRGNSFPHAVHLHQCHFFACDWFLSQPRVEKSIFECVLRPYLNKKSMFLASLFECLQNIVQACFFSNLNLQSMDWMTLYKGIPRGLMSMQEYQMVCSINRSYTWQKTTDPTLF